MIDRRQITLNAIAVAAMTGPALASNSRPADGRFPDDFLWGASTAGHQIEGNDTASDMWFVENLKPTFFREPAGDACNSFELWRNDLDLVKEIGLNAYRFSLEWSRIEPVQGQFSNAMLDHYKAIIEACRVRGITPVVTFNHYTTPLWFAARGAWTNADAPSLFTRFCERAARHLASGIGSAATLNEPNVASLILDGRPDSYAQRFRDVYASAAAATGAKKFTLSQLLAPEDIPLVTRNQIAAHKSARTAIKSVRPDLPVGVCLAMRDEEEGVSAHSLRDEKREQFYGAWLDAAKGDDFVGVQNYTRILWGQNGQLPVPADARRDMDGRELYPRSLANTVRYAHARSGCPVLVTEHGVATDDDTIRAWFIPAALRELKAALDEGVPVTGYLHWSLLDNFEWSLGYSHHYGLAAVDRSTFQRILKPSAKIYGAMASRNAV